MFSTDVTPTPNSSIERQRGGCLTVWLGVSLAIALLGVLSIIQLLDLLRPGALPRGESTSTIWFMIIVLGGLLAGRLASLYAIWNWKRWGVYSLIVVTIVSYFVQHLFPDRTPLLNCLDLLLEFLILWLVVRRRWLLFD